MSNESIDWIKKSIADECINYYEYSDFKLIKPIGYGSSGSVVCASWKHSNYIFALKSFNNNNEQTILKEVVNEV